MHARVGRRTWLALSALVVTLLFATVAADAKLQGTRPPSPAALTKAAVATCGDQLTCLSRSVPLRKAARSSRGDCSAPLVLTL
jgi:hypothetical protein